MGRIRIYTTRWCGFCVRAKTLLDSKGLLYEEVSLDDALAFRQTVYDATGGWTVPQILVERAGSAVGEADDTQRKTPRADDVRWQPIGGYTELWRLDREGRLDDFLAA
jgi:glutaredoxin 3